MELEFSEVLSLIGVGCVRQSWYIKAHPACVPLKGVLSQNPGEFGIGRTSVAELLTEGLAVSRPLINRLPRLHRTHPCFSLAMTCFWEAGTN